MIERLTVQLGFGDQRHEVRRRVALAFPLLLRAEQRVVDGPELVLRGGAHGELVGLGRVGMDLDDGQVQERETDLARFHVLFEECRHRLHEEITTKRTLKVAHLIDHDGRLGCPLGARLEHGIELSYVARTRRGRGGGRARGGIADPRGDGEPDEDDGGGGCADSLYTVHDLLPLAAARLARLSNQRAGEFVPPIPLSGASGQKHCAPTRGWQRAPAG